MARLYLTAVLDRIYARVTGHILRRSGAEAGAGLRVRGAVPYVRNEGRLSLGAGVRLRNEPARIRIRTTPRGAIRLGDNVSLNSGVALFSDAGIDIGRDSRIGDHCTLYDTSFHAVHEGQASRPRPIRIGRNVWLGRNVTILPGVSVGDHAVIAAGAVVFDDVPARQLWCGNPARFRKEVRASDDFCRQ